MAYWEILMMNYVIYDLESNMGFNVLIYVIGF